MLEDFTLDTFAPLVGSAFTVRADPSSTLELDLVEAASLASAGSSPAGPVRQPFSLVFRGPLTPVAIQRIYPVEHPTLGAFELFLVPIGPDQQGMQYQAVFT
jgi:hypothetical protein